MQNDDSLPLLVIEPVSLKATLPIALILAPILSERFAVWFMAVGFLVSFGFWIFFTLTRNQLLTGHDPESPVHRAILDANVYKASCIIPRQCFTWILIGVWLGCARVLWTFESFFPALIALQGLASTVLMYRELFLAKKEHEQN